jgi:hypothetical protein
VERVAQRRRPRDARFFPQQVLRGSAILQQRRNRQQILRRGEVAPALARIQQQRRLPRSLIPHGVECAFPVNPTACGRFFDHQAVWRGKTEAAHNARHNIIEQVIAQRKQRAEHDGRA